MITIGSRERNRLWFSLTFSHVMMPGCGGFFLGFAWFGDRWVRIKPAHRGLLFRERRGLNRLLFGRYYVTVEHRGGKQRQPAPANAA